MRFLLEDIMSGKALRDLNILPASGLEKQNDGSTKGSFVKTYIENANENLDKRLNDNSLPIASAPLNESNWGSNNVEAANNEVEYIESENLTDLLSVDASINTLVTRLDSKDWVLICEALNNVRQVSIYHKEKLLDMLGDLIPLIVKSLKNPRSAVCKTAIMTSADMFKAFRDSVVDLLDPLLVQLLLKSAQDKRFVCEAAEAALVAMTTSVSPSLLLPKLQPQLKNRNPRIRAKASLCFSRSVPRLGLEEIKAYGLDKLIQIAASQLSDQLPESREAARMLVLDLHTIFEKSLASKVNEDSGQLLETDSWEAFCQAELSPLSAQAILRVTSTSKEAPVSVASQ